MKTNFVQITHKKKDYRVNSEKLSRILSILEGKVVNIDDIQTYLSKYKLFDEVFLLGVNKL